MKVFSTSVRRAKANFGLWCSVNCRFVEKSWSKFKSFSVLLKNFSKNGKFKLIQKRRWSRDRELAVYKTSFPWQNSYRNLCFNTYFVNSVNVFGAAVIGLRCFALEFKTRCRILSISRKRTFNSLSYIIEAFWKCLVAPFKEKIVYKTLIATWSHISLLKSSLDGFKNFF